MGKLTHLHPRRVFHYFEEICAIPHGSGDTRRISDYCVAFAKSHGLWCRQDALNNVIIKKSATAGYEDHPAVILQGHLDMVCEKAPDCAIDFTADGLDVDTDGEWVFAHGTTLGGDDGSFCCRAENAVNYRSAYGRIKLSDKPEKILKIRCSRPSVSKA